jgi:hypothetical protein
MVIRSGGAAAVVMAMWKLARMRKCILEGLLSWVKISESRS